MDLADKRVTVMGLGRFGGGVGVARYLVKQGADVLVTDQLDADKLKDSLAQLDGLPIEYRLGEHNVSDFTTCDLVVANPAVKPDNRFLRSAQAAGIPITSEIRLLVAALPNRLRTIGVTGTAGKSTTTAMIGHILNKAFPKPSAPSGDQSTATAPNVWVGGNLGGSLLDHLDEIGPDDWVVLELSSFMLHGLREDKHFRGWSPHIAVVTNLGENHLDWHGNLTTYIQDKQVILDYQDKKQDAVVFGPKMADLMTARVDCLRQREDDELRLLKSLKLLLPGSHNQINAVIALDVSGLAGVDRKIGEDCLADFPGLPHRLQFVAEHNGVRYFNDSKCTTPEAAGLAIKSFDEGTVHIILGGYDKGSDLKPLAGLAAQRCAGIYTVGDTGPAIQAEAEAATSRGARGAGAKVVACGGLDTAVREAVGRAQPGHVVLLSPGCASWDQFDNYEQRGERFIELVRELTV